MQQALHLVCSSCGAWIFQNRIGANPICKCGQPWIPLRSEDGEALLWPVASDASKCVEQSSPEGQWRSKVESLLQQHWDALPEALRDAIQPALAAPEPENKDDCPQAVAARYKAQSAKSRTLGQRKLQLAARAENLQQQFQEAQAEVRKLQEEIGTAQAEMEEISRIFAVKVLKPKLLEPEVPDAAAVGTSPLVRFQALLQELGTKLTDEQRDELQMLCLGVLQEASHKRQKVGPEEEKVDEAMLEGQPSS